QETQGGRQVRKLVAVGLMPVRLAVAAPVGRIDVPAAAQRIHQKLERRGDSHPAMQQHDLRRVLRAPMAHVVAQAANIEIERLTRAQATMISACLSSPSASGASS